ncbi:hypothetical protein ACHAW5_003433 [Stephanodiscus triporus]|uniref:Uncharacterized protein n=1 Tax=Stephanodiscus triporus TaxID=2934178 RepID=A0ABD3NPI9_9STRA
MSLFQRILINCRTFQAARGSAFSLLSHVAIGDPDEESSCYGSIAVREAVTLERRAVTPIKACCRRLSRTTTDAVTRDGAFDFIYPPSWAFLTFPYQAETTAPGLGDNYGVDVDDDGHDTVQTEITYVGFKGKGTNVRRRAVEAVYETMGMKADHKQPGNEYFARQGL